MDKSPYPCNWEHICARVASDVMDIVVLLGSWIMMGGCLMMVLVFVGNVDGMKCVEHPESRMKGKRIVIVCWGSCGMDRCVVVVKLVGICHSSVRYL